MTEEIQKIIDETENMMLKKYEDEAIKVIELKIRDMIRKNEASLLSKLQ